VNPFRPLKRFFLTTGELALFAIQAGRESFHRPLEFGETLNQLYEIGWRSLPLLTVAGFAIGTVLALQTRSSMQSFGAEALIPEAVSFGLFRDVGPLVTGLLVSGRVGAVIGAELAEMRVTSQIDALECLAVDSLKYLAVTRIIACVIALPILTNLLNFSGLAGGMTAEFLTSHMSAQLYLNDAFRMMSWSDYIPPTVKTLAFGFLIGTVSTFLGYTASKGAAGVGRASTLSVVTSSLLVILSDVILVKLILFWFPG